MKVAYLTAGAAGMYCGSCLNDNTLARKLGQKGIDVALIPTYTPIRTDEIDVSMDRVFFGGINVYLQQKFSFFRKGPRFLDKIFNSKPLLTLASKMSGSTNARMLGELTIAVLEGDHGPLRKELDKLVEWLASDFKPDLVHLTNAMFVGLAARIKQELNVPVTCGLPGEDLFLDALIEPYKSEAMNLLRRAAQDIDAFTAPSQYYQKHMVQYLQVPDERIYHVDLGLDLPEDHTAEPRKRNDEPFTIGYLGRRAPEKGLHLLVEAFIHLARKVGPEKVKLRVAGFLSPQDKAYYQREVNRIEKAGLAHRVDWIGEVDREGKREFYKSLHVFSMPAPYVEPKGRSILEALAHGVPVVQPNHGAFPHLIEQTQGGLLVKPGDALDLARGIERLMDKEDERLAKALAGRDAVLENYTADKMADRVLSIWQQVV